jgi:flavin reductase (DIM6/NTAB) family NADH-FMN oxidoreductase RutF
MTTAGLATEVSAPVDPTRWSREDHVDLDTFRAVMGSLATGVSVVTSLGEGAAPRGLTCSAVCSVSATPPLLLACVKLGSATLDAIHESEAFAVNILASGTDQLARTFASPVPERFDGVRWTGAPRTGAPLLTDHSTAWAECAVVDSRQVGDHQLVVGRILSGGTSPSKDPLAFWRTRFTPLARPEAVPDAATG